MPTQFWVYLAAFSALVLAELGATCFERYMLKLPKPQKFLNLWRNAAIWSDLVLVGTIAAFILTFVAIHWQLQWFVLIFVGFTIGGACYLVPLLIDSLKNPSGLFRDGLSPLAGVLHYVYWVGGMAICLSFYILTPRGVVTKREVIVITVLLMIHWVVSVIQPPYAMHGEVNPPAKLTAIAGLIILPLLAARMIFAL